MWLCCSLDETNVLGIVTLQLRQPLPRIINLSNSRISILPEGEEFLVVLDGYFGTIPNLYLKIFPFVFDSFHELLEAGLTADVFEEGIIFTDEGIIEKSSIHSIFKPIKCFIFHS